MGQTKLVQDKGRVVMKIGHKPDKMSGLTWH